MKKYEPIKVYVLQNGTIQTTPGLGKSGVPVRWNYYANHGMRDKRKLLVEISRRGDVYFTHKEKYFMLTHEQFESIKVFKKNVKIK